MKEFFSVIVYGAKSLGKTTELKDFVNKKKALYIDFQNHKVSKSIRDQPCEFFAKNSQKITIIDEIGFSDLYVIQALCSQKHLLNQHAYVFVCSCDRLSLEGVLGDFVGEVGFLELTSLLPTEIEDIQEEHLGTIGSLRTLYLRGGFPKSYLASDLASYNWRREYIHSFCKTSIKCPNPHVTLDMMRRLWVMLARMQGEFMDAEKLACAFDMSSKTMEKCIQVFEKTMHVRKLPAWKQKHHKKRLEKQPRIYLRDSGMLHALLEIRDYLELLRNGPLMKKSWKGFVIESVINALSSEVFMSYYETVSGDSIDLVMTSAEGVHVAVKVKNETEPTRDERFESACDSLGARDRYVINSSGREFSLDDQTHTLSLLGFLKKLPLIFDNEGSSKLAV